MRITKKQLAGVDQYKYSGIDKSVLSKHVLGPFWTWLVTCFPLTLAPNTVSWAFARSHFGPSFVFLVLFGGTDGGHVCQRTQCVECSSHQITFLGLCFIFANIATLLWFDVTYTGIDLPSWVYFSWAFGLFAYQSESLDNDTCEG